MEGIQLEDNALTSEIGRVNSNYLIEEPPPDYEAPPNYEEAIKMYKNSIKNKHDNLKADQIDVELNGKCSRVILHQVQYFLLNLHSPDFR